MKKTLLSLFTASMLFGAPQAVVFDFGGVMTSEPNREAVVDFLCMSFQFSREEFEQVNKEKRLAVKQGKTDEEFWLEYAKNKMIDLPSDWTESFREVLKDSVGANPQMYLLVDELKERNVQVAMLSNIDHRLAKLIREFGFYDPFSPCLLSCEIGIEKPNPQIYEYLLTELNLPAHDVVFIDDKEKNVEAAKALGIDAILFESEDQLRSDLIQREAL